MLTGLAIGHPHVRKKLEPRFARGSRLRIEWIAGGCTAKCFWTGTRRLIASLESRLRFGLRAGLRPARLSPYRCWPDAPRPALPSEIRSERLVGRSRNGKSKTFPRKFLFPIDTPDLIGVRRHVNISHKSYLQPARNCRNGCRTLRHEPAAGDSSRHSCHKQPQVQNTVLNVLRSSAYQIS